VISEALKH